MVRICIQMRIIGFIESVQANFSTWFATIGTQFGDIGPIESDRANLKSQVDLLNHVEQIVACGWLR